MTQIPAGWYPDPAPETLPGRQRYWDGTRWTEHVHDPQPVPPPVPPAYPAYPAYPGPTAQPGVTAQPGAAAYPAAYAPVTKPARTTPDGQPLSGWWRRVLAMLLDGLFLSPVVAAVWGVFVAVHWDEIHTWFNDYRDSLDAGTSTPTPPDLFQPYSTSMLAVTAVYTVLLAVYTLGFWRWKQATPGKLVVGVRIRRREQPGPLPWSTMLARFLFVQVLALAAYVPYVGFVFVLVAALDYLWPLWDGKNQALHEKLARTNVVLAQPSDRHARGEPTTAELTAAGLPPRW